MAYGGLGNLIQDGVQTNFRAELIDRVDPLRALAVVLDARAASLLQWLLTPWTRGSRERMNVFADTWAYLTDASHWTGEGGMLQLLVEQLLLSVTALVIAMVVGLPVALWLGHLGRGGFLAINISNIGRAVPTFALLAILVTADHPGRGDVRPVRTRRAGHADRARPVRAAADHHQRVRRGARGAGRRPAGRRRHGDDRHAEVLPGRAAAGPAPGRSPGVRLALVQVWATATIAALVAGPGLGRVITDGFYRANYPKGIAGAIVVAAVALVLELARGLGPARRRPRARPIVTETSRRECPTGVRTVAASTDAVGA